MPLFEIERKFIVAGDFRPYATGSTRIAQGYIASGGGRTVRVRIRGEKGYLTIKGPSNKAGLGRFEWEKEIPLDEAEALMAICEPGIIRKTRWLVPSEDGRHTWEIDVFEGENDGLISVFFSAHCRKVWSSSLSGSTLGTMTFSTTFSWT